MTLKDDVSRPTLKVLYQKGFYNPIRQKEKSELEEEI